MTDGVGEKGCQVDLAIRIAVEDEEGRRGYGVGSQPQPAAGAERCRLVGVADPHAPELVPESFLDLRREVAGAENRSLGTGRDQLLEEEGEERAAVDLRQHLRPIADDRLQPRADPSGEDHGGDVAPRVGGGGGHHGVQRV